MWHETAEEMRALLTSVFKVDKDKGFYEMSILLIFLKVDYEQALPKNKENFKWEIHVLFDDAINCNFQTSEIVPNEFLRTFCNEMATMMASYAIIPNGHVTDEDEVVVTKTPYGGLIVWTLPGGSVLFCHLKEKAVIRNKKRWSQCMYFLYFLGHPRLPTRFDFNGFMKTS